MQTPYAQMMPILGIILDRTIPAAPAPQPLIHGDGAQEEEPYGKIRCFNSLDWHNDSDEQEWRNDYYHSIRL